MRAKSALRKRGRGFSLIELIVVMAIIGIIAAVSSASIINVIGLFIFLPEEMNVKGIAHDIEDAIIEGDAVTRGLRCAASIIDASSTQATYSYGYPDAVKYVRFRYSTTDLGWGTKKIYSYTSNDGRRWSNAKVVPIYIRRDITVEGRTSAATIFTYYKFGNITWRSSDGVRAIRRADIGIKVTSPQTVGGNKISYSLTSSVEVNQY